MNVLIGKMKPLDSDAKKSAGGEEQFQSQYAWYLRDLLTNKKAYKVDKQTFRIGRTPDADISCRCQCVSRNHVTLTLRDDGMLLIKDEGVSDFYSQL